MINEITIGEIKGFSLYMSFPNYPNIRVSQNSYVGINLIGGYRLLIAKDTDEGKALEKMIEDNVLPENVTLWLNKVLIQKLPTDRILHLFEEMENSLKKYKKLRQSMKKLLKESK